jgi:hypothetical protein
MRPNLNQLIIFFASLLLFGCASQASKPVTIQSSPVVIPCYQDAANQFLRWNKIDGKESKGLALRRKEEMELFLEGCNDETI